MTLFFPDAGMMIIDCVFYRWNAERIDDDVFQGERCKTGQELLYIYLLGMM